MNNRKYSVKKIIGICMAIIILFDFYGCTVSSEKYVGEGTKDSQENTLGIEYRINQPQMGVETCENEPDTEQDEPENHGMDAQKNSNYFEYFEDMKKKHIILSCSIGSSPKYDYENTPLAEYVEKDIVYNEEMSKKAAKSLPLEIDYHLFDFNDDGIEDYLLCESGLLFDGNGNNVEIYIQEEKGIRLVLSMPMIFHNSPADHEKIRILDEKTRGYYAIVPPYKNFILRYDAEQGRYSTEDSQGNALGIDDEQDEPEMELENEETKLEEEQVESVIDDDKVEKNNNYFLNYEDLEQNHKVLAYDICSEPKYDYKNTPLAEYVEEVLAHFEEEAKRVGRQLPIEIEYHMFDFNDDGAEDYLLCIYGTSFAQDDEVVIFIQEEEGVERVFYIDMKLHGASLEHYRFTILDEKTNGYYAIAPPYGNYILRYDAEQGRYDFGVRE